MTVQEIDAMLRALEEKFQRLTEAYQRDTETYQKDKETLERMREFSLRQGLAPARHEQPLSGRITPTRSGKKTNRQTIREFLAQWTGSFSIGDLIAAAERAGRKDVAEIDQNVWAATLFWLVQNGLVAVVEPRKGNKPGKYRVTVSPDELIAPKRKPKKNEFPLQSLVYEGIKNITTKRFGRKELTEFLLEAHPEYAERITADLVGAVLHRLFKEKKAGLSCVERGKQGNIYEKD